MMKPNHFGVTSLDENRLSSVIPRSTFPGGALIGDSSTMLFLWRSVSTQKARGGTIAFYLSDDRLETLWRSKERYATEFARFGIAAAIEVDFSLWCDDPIELQLANIKRKRITSRIFQSAGLRVVPDLNWSNEESFPFCFSGIPVGIPVAMTECRTAGGNDADRRAFLAGLQEGVKQVQPQHICIYGGQEHAYWLTERLPPGPQYTLLEAWTSARGKIRAAQERQLREKNQPSLFGGEQWVDVDQAAA